MEADGSVRVGARLCSAHWAMPRQGSVLVQADRDQAADGVLFVSAQSPVPYLAVPHPAHPGESGA